MTKNIIYLLIAVLVVGLVLVISLPQKGLAPTNNISPTVTLPVVVETIPEPVIIRPTNGTVTLGAGEKGQVGDLSIVWNGPVQDSRCPKNVQCIWAGQAVANVALADKTNSETVSMILGKAPQLFYGHQISITSVTPYPAAPGEIAIKNYRITFVVTVAK